MNSPASPGSHTTARPEPVTDDDVVVAEITTRDIDRGACSALPAEGDHRGARQPAQDAPRSDHRTPTTRCASTVGERTLPSGDRLPSRAAGEISRVRVIGQGTAAVAGQSLAAILDELTDGSLDIDAITATELSGFNLRRDMTDTLAIAVSQSGTTTDTNRTVDLLRGRGAAVISIVNRRNSDLCDKSDGVLYTSDGRDVEMSVASTKAFYAQVAAGVLLACAISEEAGLGTRRPPPPVCCPRCVRCPTRCAPCSRSAPRSPLRRTGSHRTSATGRWSATAPTRSPPRRCGSSSPSCATSRSPATSPRTRSTSTSRPSR